MSLVLIWIVHKRGLGVGVKVGSILLVTGRQERKVGISENAKRQTMPWTRSFQRYLYTTLSLCLFLHFTSSQLITHMWFHSIGHSRNNNLLEWRLQSYTKLTTAELYLDFVKLKLKIRIFQHDLVRCVLTIETLGIRSNCTIRPNTECYTKNWNIFKKRNNVFRSKGPISMMNSHNSWTLLSILPMSSGQAEFREY